MMDKNYNPLNPMVDQVKKFLDQKKVPQEQVVPFLMSLGYRGLAGAVAGRMRLEKASEGIKALQQAQGEAPAPPNVVQENAMQAQQMQQGIQQALASRRPPMAAAPPIQNVRGGGLMSAYSGGGPIAFQKGGGPIAFQVGGGMPGGNFDSLNEVQDLIEAYDKAAGNPAEQSRIQKMIQKAFPTFSSVEALKGELAKLRGIGGGSGIVSKAGKLSGYAAVPLAVTESAYQGIMTDPSILAEEYGMDPSKFGRQATAQGLGYLENLASNLSFGAYGALRGRPYDRARERTEQRIADINRGGPQLNLSSEEAAIGQEFNRIVREYGANSKEAKDFEARYRDAMGRASPAAEDELARIMSQSAAGEPAARPAGPRLPSVSTTAQETKTLSDLRERLKGMEDVSKPEAREAAIDREIAARMKRYTDMGIMKPFDDAKANVQGRLKELDGIKDKNFYKAMAMMGFTMAGTRGSFFQALAAGGAAGLSAYETFEERRQATLDKLQDRMMNIDMGIANIKERAGAGAETRVDKLESERNRVQDQITNLQSAQETLAQTQSFQLAMSDREIAAQAARDESRFGGLGKELEQEILVARDIASGKTVDPATKKPYPPDIREAAKKEVERLYKERERATQVGSGSYQSAALKALASQIPHYNYPMVGSEQGGASDDIDALVAQYLK